MDIQTVDAAARGHVVAPVTQAMPAALLDLASDPYAIGVIEVDASDAHQLRKEWRLDAIDNSRLSRHHPTLSAGTWLAGETPDTATGEWTSAPRINPTVHFYRERHIAELRDWPTFLAGLEPKPASLIQGRLKLEKRQRRDIRGLWHVPGHRKEHYDDAPRAWLILDVDGLAVDYDVRFASWQDIEGSLNDLIDVELPALADTSYVAVLTGSAGINPYEIRGRVIFELEKPATLRHKKRLIEHANAVAVAAGRKKPFDTSIYSSNSLVFTAAPRFYAATETGDVELSRPHLPSPTAWFVEREHDTVAIPVVESAHAPVDLKTMLDLGMVTDTKAEVSDLLAEIGSGPTPYHMPTLRLIGSLAYRTPPIQADVTIAKYMALVRERVVATSAPGDVQARIDEHLKLDWWRQCWAATVMWRNGLHHRAAPAALTVTPSPIAAAAAAIPQSIADAREDLATRVAQAADTLDSGQSKKHYLVTAPPGFGKSHALKAVVTQARLTNRRIRLFVPTHKLAEQALADTQSWAGAMQTGPGEIPASELGARIRHHKGRDQPGMCPDPDFKPMADRAASLGLSPKKYVCGNCPTGKAGACPWFNQASDTGPGLIIEAHAKMAQEIAAGDGWADLYIIDEGAHGTLVGIRRQTTGKTLLTDLDPGANAVRKRRRKGDVYSRGTRWQASKDLQRYRELLIAAVTAAIPAEKHKPGGLPTAAVAAFFAQEKRRVVEDGEPVDSTRMVIEHALLLEAEHRKALASEILAARDGGAIGIAEYQRQHGISLEATRIFEAIKASRHRERVFGVRAYRTGAGKGVAHVQCETRIAVPADIRAKGAIWLDGSASGHVFRAVLSPDGAPVDVEVIHGTAPISGVHLTQYVDRPYSRSMFLGGDDGALDDAIADAESGAAAAEAAKASLKLPAWMQAEVGMPDFAGQAKKLRTRAAVGRALKQQNKERSDANIQQLWRYVLTLALSKWRSFSRLPGDRFAPEKQQHAVLLVGQKAVIARLEAIGFPENVYLAHFNALKGLNTFKHVGTAVVVGRPALGNTDLELLTEALHMHNPNVLETQRSDTWGEAELTIDGPAGPTIVKTEAHPDPLCRELGSVLTGAEVVQAVARIRPFDRSASNPCSVHVFGKHPAGLKVDAWGHWSDADRGWQDIAVSAGAIFAKPATNQLVYRGIAPAAGDGGRDAGEQRSAWINAVCGVDHEILHIITSRDHLPGGPLYINRRADSSLPIGDLPGKSPNTPDPLPSGVALAIFRVWTPGSSRPHREHALLAPDITPAFLEQMCGCPVSDFEWLPASDVCALLNAELNKALKRHASGTTVDADQARQCLAGAADPWSFAREVLGWPLAKTQCNPDG